MHGERYRRLGGCTYIETDVSSCPSHQAPNSTGLQGGHIAGRLLIPTVSDPQGAASGGEAAARRDLYYRPGFLHCLPPIGMFPPLITITFLEPRLSDLTLKTYLIPGNIGLCPEYTIRIRYPSVNVLVIMLGGFA